MAVITYDWFGSKDFDKLCELSELNSKSLRQSLVNLRSSDNPKTTADNMISSIRALVWQKESVGKET